MPIRSGENLTQTAKVPINIGMLLLPAFNSMAMHAFIDPFRAANYLRGDTLYQWQFLSLDGSSVTASNGLVAGNTRSYADDFTPFDFLIINSSWTPEKFQDHQLKTWLRRLAHHHTTLGGIDTGAFVLAFAGLMSGYRAVVHYEHHTSFEELFPNIQLEETLFVIDRDRLTCSGGLAAVDLALEIIHRQHGLNLANAVAHYIFKERLRSEDEKQLSRMYEPIGYAVPELLREAIILMERHLEEPLRLSAIAHLIGVSQRQLERLFRKHTGLTPVRYYINIRLDRARALLTQTELPLIEIASACGFNSAEHFSRAYKHRFEIVPSLDRTEGRVPFQFRAFPGYAGM
ncbi:MAG: GlxA family transcriptional regulator [Chloroflexota bacterium]